MTHSSIIHRSAFAATAAVLLTSNMATPQPPRTTSARPRAKLEAVAETKLLMEGLLLPNFKGLERNLRQRPADDTAWTFARGQALIVAETGNLLLLRPPKSSGQDVWIELAADLREKAARLARSVAAKDLEQCRTGLADLAVTCNRCHQTFGQSMRLVPFADAP